MRSLLIAVAVSFAMGLFVSRRASEPLYALRNTVQAIGKGDLSARVPFRRFFPWCVAAGLLWGTGSTLLGYFVGRNFETLERFVRRFSLAILAAVILGVGVYVLLGRRSRQSLRRRRRRSERRRTR